MQEKGRVSTKYIESSLEDRGSIQVSYHKKLYIGQSEEGDQYQ